MDRRQFLGGSGIAAGVFAGLAVPTSAANAVRSAPVPATARARKPVRMPMLMKLGSLCERVTDAQMKYYVRWGIRNIYARAPIKAPDRLYATVDELSAMLEIAHRNGVSIDILRPAGYLDMANIDAQKHPAIMLAEDPQRDRDIEAFQTQIRNCAKVGIPAIRYTLSILGNSRTGNVPGRGDSIYKQSIEASFKSGAPLTTAAVVSEAQYWDRIKYFLDRVVPVANEYKIKLLSHMEDAMTPPTGYRGLHPVTNTIEGAKKFVSVQESPYHGLLFCVGTFAEMTDDPQRNLYEALRWFGERKKIFMVDFRNIRGGRHEFVETFPDEGDIDMVRVVRMLRDMRYDGMLCPDHEPVNPDGPKPVDAFQYGYIRGVMQSVQSMT